MTPDKDEPKTVEKTNGKNEKVTKEKTSNAVFLLDANEKTKNVKGTHVNFAAEDKKEKPQDSSASTKNTDSDK